MKTKKQDYVYVLHFDDALEGQTGKKDTETIYKTLEEAKEAFKAEIEKIKKERNGVYDEVRINELHASFRVSPYSSKLKDLEISEALELLLGVEIWIEARKNNGDKVDGYIYVFGVESTIDFETSVETTLYKSINSAKKALKAEVDKIKKECKGAYNHEEIHENWASFYKEGRVSEWDIELWIRKEEVFK